MLEAYVQVMGLKWPVILAGMGSKKGWLPAVAKR